MKLKAEVKEPATTISAVWLSAMLLAVMTNLVSATDLRAHLAGSNLVLSWPTNTMEERRTFTRVGYCD